MEFGVLGPLRVAVGGQAVPIASAREAHTGDSLGFIHHHLGRHAQALACYQEALDLYRTIGDHHSQATTLSRIGDTHRATGDVQAAASAWRQAVAILDELGHPDADEVRAKLRGQDA